MSLHSFVYGDGPFGGMSGADFSGGADFGLGGMGGMQDFNNFGAMPRYRIFGPVPQGLTPVMAQSYRTWRMGAIFRLAILLFIGLPVVCLLLFYGFGVMGDAFRALAPHLPEQLRPGVIGFSNILVTLRDVVAPFVSQATSILQGIVDWLRSLIEGFMRKS